MSDARGKGVLPGLIRAPAMLAVAAVVPLLAGSHAGSLAGSHAGSLAGSLAGAHAGSHAGRYAKSQAGAHAAASRASEVICSGYSRCAAHGHSDHGYPRHAGASYWRMTAGNECTNYVAYVEARVLRARRPRYLLGNASQWAAAAAAHGVVVNHVPSAGSVAEWNGGAPGMGPEGHVAVVEKVGPRDRYILISQQHIGSDRDGYDWTRINAGFPAGDWQEWPDHFIHFAGRRVTGSAHTAAGYYDPLDDDLGPPGTVSLARNWTGRPG
ncbi:MAG: CHAP domain-containing protein [Streptosporangiaceae bacterium]